MSGDSRRASLLVLGWFASACATSSAPEGYLPTIPQVQAEALGGWVEVTYRGDSGLDRVEGELIAVTEDSLWVRRTTGGVVIPTGNVVGGKLTSYDARASQVSGLTVLGFLSTLSNGVFLVATAPMWVIGGSLASASQSRVAMEDLPTQDWAYLSAFARFPQGIPPGVELETLRPVVR